jgi:hypothetical protein
MQRLTHSSLYVLMLDMTRLASEAVALHLEVALSGAAPYLLADLQHADRFRRTAAVSTLAHHLAQRMRCFDIRRATAQPSRARPE